MEFTWSKEQEGLYHSVLEFARDEIDAGLDSNSFKEPYSRSLWEKCGNFGLLDLAVAPPISATPAHDILTSVRAMEAFGYGCRDNGLALALSTQIWTVQHPIQKYGTTAQKEKYLGPLSRGKLIGAHAITEPNAGSDAYSLEMLAKRVDGGYLLSGVKCMISSAPVADVVFVFATIDPTKGAFGITAFIVDASSEGFSVEGPIEKMGLTTVPMGHITLDDCFVPEENRIGPEGAGLAMSNASLEFERACILAPQVGAMQRQLEDSISFVRKRKQFGQPVGKFQSVSNRITEMKLRLELARLLMYKVAWLKDQGNSIALESAMLKLFISESFLESSLDAIRIHGGAGYVSEFGVERNLRDAVGGTIYGGTSDIQRNIIARILGL